jgi:hypothetical protein
MTCSNTLTLLFLLHSCASFAECIQALSQCRNPDEEELSSFLSQLPDEPIPGLDNEVVDYCLALQYIVAVDDHLGAGDGHHHDLCYSGMDFGLYRPDTKFSLASTWIAAWFLESRVCTETAG